MEKINKYQYIESMVENYLVNLIEKNEGLCIKFKSTSENGVPDRIVLHKGKTYFVELKAPGEKPRIEQKVVHHLFEDVGIPVYVLDTIELVEQFVKEIVQFNQIQSTEKFTQPFEYIDTFDLERIS